MPAATIMVTLLSGEVVRPMVNNHTGEESPS